MKKFKIHYRCVSELDAASLWDEGDAPDNPSAADVRALIKRCGGIYKVLGDWCLDEYDREWWVEELTDGVHNR